MALDHVWSQRKLVQGPVSTKAAIGGIPETSLREWTRGQGGTGKHGEEGVSPGQAGACLGHYLTAGSI